MSVTTGTCPSGLLSPGVPVLDLRSNENDGRRSHSFCSDFPRNAREGHHRSSTFGTQDLYDQAARRSPHDGRPSEPSNGLRDPGPSQGAQEWPTQ